MNKAYTLLHVLGLPEWINGWDGFLFACNVIPKIAMCGRVVSLFSLGFYHIIFTSCLLQLPFLYYSVLYFVLHIMPLSKFDICILFCVIFLVPFFLTMMPQILSVTHLHFHVMSSASILHVNLLCNNFVMSVPVAFDCE